MATEGIAEKDDMTKEKIVDLCASEPSIFFIAEHLERVASAEQRQEC